MSERTSKKRSRMLKHILAVLSLFLGSMDLLFLIWIKNLIGIRIFHLIRMMLVLIFFWKGGKEVKNGIKESTGEGKEILIIITTLSALLTFNAIIIAIFPKLALSNNIYFMGICSFIGLVGEIGIFWTRFTYLGKNWKVNPGTKCKYLVKEGPYKFVRHPMYALGFLQFGGIALVFPALLSLIILFCIIKYYIKLADSEDNFMLQNMDSESKFLEYWNNTNEFFPRLWEKALK